MGAGTRPARDNGGGWLAAGAAVALATILLMLPALLAGELATHSAVYNHVWTSQFADALRRGEIYPRWLPDSFRGYGDPVFYFYPPLAFYLSGGLRLLGLSTTGALNGAFLVVLMASGLAMYAWLKGRASRPIVWAVLYMAAPYHLTDIYARGALAEAAAFVWLPLVALGITEGRWRLLSLAYAGLICTHLPVALLASLGLMAPLAAGALREPARLRAIVVGGLVGLLLSSVYLVPALALQRYAAVDLLYLPYYRPQNWYLFAHSAEVNRPLLSGFALTFAAASLALLLVVRRAPLWVGIAWASGLAAVGLLPIWGIPLLAKVQFPWRLLTVVEFAAVSAFALASGTSRTARGLVLAGAVALALPGLLFLAGQNIRPFFKIFPAEAIAAADDAPEYLPAGVDAEGITAGDRTPALGKFGGRAITDPIMVTQPSTVVLRRFYFPSWVVTRDGRAIPTRPAGPGRLIGFEAQPGAYRLQRRILPEEWLGLDLSILGVWVLIGSFVVRRLASAAARPPVGLARA